MGYLHIGQNVMVPEKQIIGIFDLDNTSQTKWTRKFLADAEQEGVVLSVTEDVAVEFEQAFAGHEREILLAKENGKYQLDLWKANEIVLLDAGVLPETS